MACLYSSFIKEHSLQTKASYFKFHTSFQNQYCRSKRKSAQGCHVYDWTIEC